MKLTLPALVAFAATASAADVRVTVEAGDFDRRDTVVSFAWPAGVSPRNALRRGEASVPLQVSTNGEAWFIVPELKRGETRTYTAGDAAVRESVAAKTDDKAVALSAQGKTALVYRTTKTDLPPNRPDLKPIFQRGAYIHPVLSPSGKQVTDDYPSNHKHHHGIWFAWTSTEFDGRKPDFWNMGEGKGTVQFVSLDRTWSGPVHAGFASKHRQVDLTATEPRAALNEAWTVRLFAAGVNARQPYYLFDLEVVNTCGSAMPVKLPQYRYGGIGVRGNWAWNDKRNLRFLASNGSTDRTKGDKNQTRGHWAHLGGPLDGGLTGIAILSHPENPHSPQPMRIHPEEPFFNFAPQQAGPLEITPGKPLVQRYRFVVADGAPDKAELDRIWNDYAHPPKVMVER
jgi:hypothetical protein